MTAIEPHNYQAWLAEIDNNLRRERKAHALARAVADCDPADRLPFLETLIEGLCQSGPPPAFGSIMASARDWTRWATRAEVKAYGWACFEAMSGQDRAAFLGLLDRRDAA